MGDDAQKSAILLLTASIPRCTLMASALTARRLSPRVAAMHLMRMGTCRCLPGPSFHVNKICRHAGGRSIIINLLYGSSHATRACSHPYPVAAYRTNSIEHISVPAVSGQFRCALGQTLKKGPNVVRDRTGHSVGENYSSVDYRAMNSRC